MYQANFGRVFGDVVKKGWRDAKPIVAMIIAAGELPPGDLLKRILGEATLTRLFACGMLKRASASRRLKDIVVPFCLFVGDGKKIASGSNDKTVRLWNFKRASASRRLRDIMMGFVLFASAMERRLRLVL